MPPGTAKAVPYSPDAPGTARAVPDSPDAPGTAKAVPDSPDVGRPFRGAIGSVY
jgi:hypothetical protein